MLKDVCQMNKVIDMARLSRLKMIQHQLNLLKRSPLSISKNVFFRERERERERGKERESDRQTDRQTDRQRETERDREREGAALIICDF